MSFGLTLAQLQQQLEDNYEAIRRIKQSLTQEHWTGGDRHMAPQLVQLVNEQKWLLEQIEAKQIEEGRSNILVSKIAVTE